MQIWNFNEHAKNIKEEKLDFFKQVSNRTVYPYAMG